MGAEQRKILAEIQRLNKEFEAAILADENEKAEEISEEIEAKKKSYTQLKSVEETNAMLAKNAGFGSYSDGEGEKVDKTVKAVKDFANAARKGFRNALNEGSAADGGYTVPEDISTKVEQYRDAQFSLRELVTVQNVKTLSGARTFQKRSAQTGFTSTAEGGKTKAGALPQFERIEYKVVKYDGYYAVTQEVLEDSDENITNVITEWIGNEARATDNNNILAAVQTKAATSVTVSDTNNGVDNIKTAINVTLGQDFKATSAIVTNDDGLNYLDTLKDSDGRYLLTSDIADVAGGGLRFRVGATNLPVVVIPNKTLASDTSTKGKRGLPFTIGDLKEGVVIFDRKQITIRTSDVATVGDISAFESDNIIFKGTLRQQVVVKDAEAFVNLMLVVTDSTVTGS
jgi:HK97 family phage major capsid protein